MLSFLETEIGRILISVIWGIGLSTLFKRVCKNKKCIVIESPNPKDIGEKYFKYKGDNNCYRYDTYISKCRKNPQNIIKTRNLNKSLNEDKENNIDKIKNVLKKYNINF